VDHAAHATRAGGGVVKVCGAVPARYGMAWAAVGRPRGDAYTLSAKNARRRDTGFGGDEGSQVGVFQRRSAAPEQQRRRERRRGEVSAANVVTCAEAGVLGAVVVGECRVLVPDMALSGGCAGQAAVTALRKISRQPCAPTQPDCSAQAPSE
jgi:hypothetical protein